jgi:hypothetical protein
MGIPGWCYLAKITTLLLLQIPNEYHKFFEISKVMINSSDPNYQVNAYRI